MDETSKKPEIKFNAEMEELKGRYANRVNAVFLEKEIVLDFISEAPIGNLVSQTLVSRMFIHHHMADNLIELLSSLKKQWEEEKFGTGIEPNKK